MAKPSRVRKKRQPLNRKRVLAAAVGIVDREGLDALTMRRLAAKVGVEAMSLYHHLPGKDGLLDGVAEVVVDELRAAMPRKKARGWKAKIRAQCLAARAVMSKHPWAPGLLGSRTRIPAGVFAHYDGILKTLLDGGFSYRLAHRALHAFGTMVLGFAQEVFSPAAAGGSLDAEPDAAEVAAGLPHLAAMVAAELHAPHDPKLGWCDSQVEFEFTLDLLLDGLERHRLT